VWRYPRSAEQQARWLAAAIAWANTKATAAAAALGTRVLGIHRLTEHLEPDRIGRSPLRVLTSGDPPPSTARACGRLAGSP